MSNAADPLLTGKVVLITGAGRGLGRAYALAAAQHGALVVVNDVDADAVREVRDEIDRGGGVAELAVASVADPAAATELVDGCVRRHGGIHGLVNNAGILYDAPPWEEDAGQLHRIVEINLLGTMYCGVAAIRHMRRQGQGSIVNVTSGAQSGMPFKGAYGATKAAVTTLTYAWAVDLEGSSVRVNAISPRGRTRMMSVTRELPVGLPEPEAISPLVVYLLSDEARALSGRVIRLTGSELGLVSRPTWQRPVLQRDRWDVDALRQAFATELAGAMADPETTGRWASG